MTVKVGFASCDWSRSVADKNNTPAMGGSGWARLGQYVDHLDAVVAIGVLAYNSKLKKFGVKDWLGNDHFDLDVVVMQRAMFSDIPDKIRIAQKRGQYIINDIDDWYWGLSPSNYAFKASHPKFNPNENINHYKSILSRSDLVTVSTPYLAERISKWVRGPIKLMPNTVDVERFTPHEDCAGVNPTIGWVGSTAHRSGDLQILRGVLNSIVDSGKAKIHHSGYNPTHPSFAAETGIDPEKITVLPMVAPQDYPSLFIFDVGIVPLADVPFNQAKSAIKGLEYAAAGLPFVASNTESYIALSNEGIGLVAKKNKNWFRHLEDLLDPEVRREQGQQNREKVFAYDIKHGVERWKNLLNGLP